MFERAKIILDVDSDWYLSKYPDALADVTAGLYRSAAEHFSQVGFRKGYLPKPPILDEDWYLHEYPDVARACQEGGVHSPTQHFVDFGYREGRLPSPPSRGR